MTDMMDELIPFLRARIAEERAAADAVIAARGDADEAGHWHVHSKAYEGSHVEQGRSGDCADSAIVGVASPHWGEPWEVVVNTFDPARVLAECDAKERVLSGHARTPDLFRSDGLPASAILVATATWQTAVQCIAQAYRGHADWRPEWAL